MSKSKIRAGIIGSGFAARFHFVAMQQVNCTHVEIAGVYSPTIGRLEEFTKSRKLRAYDNPEDLIEDSDVIHVCTPPVTHEPIVISALSKNKHVIVEKPLTGYFGDDSPDFNGALTHSRSQIVTVAKYIFSQEEHHKKKPFKEEYLEILEKNNVEFNKGYVFEFFDDMFGWD